MDLLMSSPPSGFVGSSQQAMPPTEQNMTASRAVSDFYGES